MTEPSEGGPRLTKYSSLEACPERGNYKSHPFLPHAPDSCFGVSMPQDQKQWCQLIKAQADARETVRQKKTALTEVHCVGGLVIILDYRLENTQSARGKCTCAVVMQCTDFRI